MFGTVIFLKLPIFWKALIIKGFVTVFDKWRENEGKKNNTEISRSDGFKAIEKIIPLLSLDVKTSGLVKRKNKEINLRIK